jgi:hypothetical protein
MTSFASSLGRKSFSRVCFLWQVFAISIQVMKANSLIFFFPSNRDRGFCDANRKQADPELLNQPLEILESLKGRFKLVAHFELREAVLGLNEVKPHPHPIFNTSFFHCFVSLNVEFINETFWF